MEELIEGRRLALSELRYERLELVESDNGGPVKVRCIAQEADVPNQNHRLYKKAILERELNKLKESLSRHPGLANHPEGQPHVENIAVLWTDFSWDGNKVVAEGNLVPTRVGEDIAAIAKAGVEIGVSSRGWGSTTREMIDGEPVAVVGDDLELDGFDFVVSPSVQSAYLLAVEGRSPSIDDLRSHYPEIVEAVEMEILEANLAEAVWTAKYINDLPDSAFAYIETGGSLDSGSKTKPRSLRHFPYKDANGNIDAAHVRNGLARVSQSSLPQDAKDKATAVLKKAAKKVGVDVSDSKEMPTDSKELVVNEDEKVAPLDAPVEEKTEAASNTDETKTEVAEGSPAESDAAVNESAELAEARKNLAEMTAKRDALMEDAANMQKIMAMMSDEVKQRVDSGDFSGASMMSQMAGMVSSMCGDSEPDDSGSAMDGLIRSVDAVLEVVAASKIRDYAFEQARTGKSFFAVMEAVKSCNSKAEVDAKIAQFSATPVAEASTKAVVSDENVDPTKARQVAARDKFRGMM